MYRLEMTYLGHRILQQPPPRYYHHSDNSGQGPRIFSSHSPTDSSGYESHAQLPAQGEGRTQMRGTTGRGILGPFHWKSKSKVATSISKDRLTTQSSLQSIKMIPTNTSLETCQSLSLRPLSARYEWEYQLKITKETLRHRTLPWSTSSRGPERFYCTEITIPGSQSIPDPLP